MPRLEFFFDCTSPWTYLAFDAVQPMCKRLGVPIEWRPILVGGVFNAINPGLYAAREAMFQNERRMTHFLKDLQDWAAFYGLKIGWPSMHPANAVKAMRGCLVAQDQGEEPMLRFARAVFAAYWGEERDIGDDAVLRDVVVRCEMDPESFFAAIQAPEIKQRLRDNTDELIARGGYGTPTMFIDGDDMYFGNDRLILVEHALKRRLGQSS